MELLKKEELIQETIVALHICEEENVISFETAFMAQEFLRQYQEVISDRICEEAKTGQAHGI